jgi:predicted transport protein
MTLAIFTTPKRITLKSHPTFSENWVQDIIANDPAILGLGDLVLRDRERRQPRAGRLDLLLQDPETYKRYEVELQLGATDEAHIIRSIEYWDIERRRYPQYEHCAVIVAEDITARFLNVIALFNGSVPIVAIQMQAYEVGEHITLVFTKVLDEFERGLVDEDEDAESAPTDRAYWETEKATPKTMALVDRLFSWVSEIDPSVELKFNKFYIGLSKAGRAWNFVAFRPKKQFVTLEPKIPRSDDIDGRLDEAGLDTLEYSSRWNHYRIRLTEKDIKANEPLIKELMQLAWQHRND